MRYLIHDLRLPIHNFCAGTALGLWFGTITLLVSSGLGGSHAHSDTVAALLMLGISLASVVKFATRTREIVFYIALIACSLPLLVFSQVFLLIVRFNLIPVAVLGLFAGLAFGLPMSSRRGDWTSFLIGILVGLTIVSILLPEVSASVPFSGSLFFGLLSRFIESRPQQRTQSTPDDVDLRQDGKIEGSKLLLVSLTAVAVGLLYVVLPRSADPVGPLPSNYPVYTLAVFVGSCLLALAWSALRWSGSGTSAFRGILSTGFAALLLTLFLWLLPKMLPIFESHLSAGGSDFWTIAVFSVLGFLLISPVLLGRGWHACSPLAPAIALLCTSLSILVANLYLLDRLPAQVLLQLCTVGLWLEVGFRTLKLCTDPNLRSFGRLSLGGFALLLSPLPWLAAPWEPPQTASDSKEVLSSSKSERAVDGELVYAGEDSHVYVVARGVKGAPKVFVNGELVRSKNTDVVEIFTAHLPLLLHPAPHKAVVIGRSIGLAPDASRRHPISSVVWAAPSPLQASIIQLFQDVNHNVQIDPRLSIDIGGPRSFAASSPAKFDAVSVIGPSARSLAARTLYSREGLRGLEALLSPGGILALSLPAEFSAEELRDMLSTFQTVFPGGMAWLTPGNDNGLVLTASAEGSTISLARLRKAYAIQKVRSQLAEIGLSSAMDVLGQLLLVPEGLSSIDGQVWTDLGPRPVLANDSSFTPVHPLVQLLPALRPILPVLTMGSGEQSMTIQADLSRMQQRIKAQLGLLAQLEKGEYSNVLEEARKLLSLSNRAGSELDGFIRPYLLRARSFEASGQLDKAIEQLSVVRIIHPENAEAPLALARISEEQDQPEHAIKMYQEVLRLAPDNANATQALANLYRAKGQVDQAIELLEGLLKRTNGDAVTFHNLGMLYLGLGKWARARELFEQSIQLNERLAQPHAGLAELYFKQGRLDAATQEIQVAARLDASPTILNLLGQIALRKGDTAIAKSAFVQCLLKDPDYVEARGSLGIIYAEAGNIDKAREAWQTVLSIDPENRAARDNLAQLDKEFPPPAQ